jgi:acyl-coenzyme A thioesterase PaaI-like protein
VPCALGARDEHLNPHGTVHGGILATMVDVAMGTVVQGEDVLVDALATFAVRPS